jgi:ribose/xylose/arabinose/galactoside ABC-type transport system permease subunit
MTPRPRAAGEHAAEGNAELELGPEEQSRPGVASRILTRLVQAPEISLVVAIVLFGLVVQSQNDQFLRYENLILVVKAAVPVFIVAATMTFVLIGGGIDLSVGSVAALGGIVTAMALTSGVPFPLAILGGLLACGVVGLTNGLLVARAGIPSLIVTLGALYAVRSLILVITNARQYFPLPDDFNTIGQEDFGVVPNLVVYAVIFGIVAHVMLEHSTYGYRVRAVGGNPAAARAAGINVTRFRISLYVVSALGAGFAGILATSRLGVGDPVLYQGFELLVISSVIVGGTSLFGAIGSIPGTALGVLLLALVNNGLLLMRVTPYLQGLVLGTVVVGAVALDSFRRKRVWRISAR